MRCPILTAVALAVALLSGPGCTLATQETGANPPVEVSKGKPRYASFERQRVGILEEALDELLAETISQAQAELDQLDADLAALPVPERFSTNNQLLRTWHQEEWDAYHDQVQALYDEALEQLNLSHEQATAEAVSRAEELVGRRSPLDEGATGNVLFDNAITSFDETLRAEVPVTDIEARAEQHAQGRIELVHVFSTFTSPGADEVLGGRLILFVGGDEHATAPHVKLVLVGGDDEPPVGVQVVQAVRHRVYRGYAVVDDLGWQRWPRIADLSFHDYALIIGNIEPRLDTSAPAFEDLHGMRVIADMQTVLVKDGAVLGGVDWRIESRITGRGDVSWKLSEVPQFNPICAEAQEAYRQ